VLVAKTLLSISKNVLELTKEEAERSNHQKKSKGKISELIGFFSAKQ